MKKLNWDVILVLVLGILFWLMLFHYAGGDSNKQSNSNSHPVSIAGRNDYRIAQRLGSEEKLHTLPRESGSHQVVSAPNRGATVQTQTKKTKTLTITGYTWTGNRTRSGKWPRRGMIAVDPSVIPLGTKVFVPGYGFAIAEDTGGAIKGNIIDLYFDTEWEAIRWGRRFNVEVTILE